MDDDHIETGAIDVESDGEGRPVSGRVAKDPSNGQNPCRDDRIATCERKSPRRRSLIREPRPAVAGPANRGHCVLGNLVSSLAQVVDESGAFGGAKVLLESDDVGIQRQTRRDEIIQGEVVAFRMQAEMRI